MESVNVISVMHYTKLLYVHSGFFVCNHHRTAAVLWRKSSTPILHLTPQNTLIKSAIQIVKMDEADMIECESICLWY